MFPFRCIPKPKKKRTGFFKGLSEGAQVTMPLADTFWNAYFGMLTDQFGVQWMVNVDHEEEKA